MYLMGNGGKSENFFQDFYNDIDAKRCCTKKVQFLYSGVDSLGESEQKYNFIFEFNIFLHIPVISKSKAVNKNLKIFERAQYSKRPVSI